MKAAPLALTLSFAVLAAAIAPALGQPQPPSPPQAKGQPFAWPDRMQNAQVLPADTSPAQLRDTMRGFAMSLGVRCTFCHVGEEGAPLTQVDFASDSNPHKNIARGMMRMLPRFSKVVVRS